MNENDERIPGQYRKGTASFMGLDIKVDERVLIPRPETELLVSVSNDLLNRMNNGSPLIADIGTGSGAITVALSGLVKNGRFIASDVSKEALSVAEENVQKYRKNAKIYLVCSDMFSSFSAKVGAKFDAIISNPPYVSGEDYDKLDDWVKKEPKTALYAGDDGMDYLKIIASQSPERLTRGGFVAVEVGYNQADRMKKELAANGFKNITGFRDFNNYERVIAGWISG